MIEMVTQRRQLCVNGNPQHQWGPVEELSAKCKICGYEASVLEVWDTKKFIEECNKLLDTSHEG